MYKAKIFVMLKDSVLDPQGKTVMHSLHTLGFDNVIDTRISKFIEIKINSDKLEEVRSEIEKMCDKVLANPNIETYKFEVELIEE